eukprot:31018-Pelagococcus_subviridis.AAC.3
MNREETNGASARATRGRRRRGKKGKTEDERGDASVQRATRGGLDARRAPSTRPTRGACSRGDAAAPRRSSRRGGGESDVRCAP